MRLRLLRLLYRRGRNGLLALSLPMSRSGWRLLSGRWLLKLLRLDRRISREVLRRLLSRWGRWRGRTLVLVLLCHLSAVRLPLLL